jgi:cation transport ATPase
MASEQMHIGGVYSETFLKIKEVHIHKKKDHLNNEDMFEKKGERKGRKEADKGLREREEKETSEKMEAKHGREVEHTRETLSKQREKEQDERSEEISKCRAQKTMDDDAIANGQEKVKQEARNKVKESEAKRVAQNKVFISISISMPHLYIYLFYIHTFIHSYKVLCFFFITILINFVISLLL